MNNNKGIRMVVEDTVMREGRIIEVNYTVRYYNARPRDYRQCTGRLIPMTVLNFILDEAVNVTTRYSNYRGDIIKTSTYKREA